MEMNQICIVGCGPGSRDYVTAAAERTISRADLFVAAPHLQELFFDFNGKRVIVGVDIEAVLTSISDHRTKRIVVGVSGDPGIASLARHVLARFGKNSCRIIPGISSLQVAFALIGRQWTDARIINAHTQMPYIDQSIEDANALAILAGKDTMPWIADFLKKSSFTYELYICEDLTLPSQRVLMLSAVEVESFVCGTRTIVLLIKKEEQ